MESKEQQGSLLLQTRALLQTCNMRYLDIYRATGLSPNWLTGIATGKITNPSVNRVQALYEYLKGDKLEI